MSSIGDRYHVVGEADTIAQMQALIAGMARKRLKHAELIADNGLESGGTVVSAVQVPPLKIQGIKTKAIPFIRDSVDWDGSGRWIEPFLGSAVVPINIKPERALLGDANPHLVRFYAAIQAGTITSASVRAFLEREGTRLLQDGQDHFYRVRERFNDNGDPHDFLFLNRACFNGLVRFNRKGRFNTPFCRKPEPDRPAYIRRLATKSNAAELWKEWHRSFLCTLGPILS